MSILMVTGTSTDVGKTVVTAALASLALQSGRSVAVLKPAQTGVGLGEPGDLAEIDRLTGGGVTPATSESVKVARTRFGESAELVFLIVTVYFAVSVAFE